jgi:hypothetical protein
MFFCGTFLFSQSNNYKTVLSDISKQRNYFKVNDTNPDSVKQYIIQQFVENVYPHWVGTPWDYNGYTNTPKQSSIACGYFVSTTLKHMGFNWNRYELAKMYSQQIVEDVCDTVKVFNSINELYRFVNFGQNNIYILGLSSHVGIIVKHKNEVWFIHSNYYDLKGPDKEKIFESDALKDSDVFWCGTFLTDSNINKWLNNTPYNLVRKK